MIKTNIKMRVTPEQSRKVQVICFENDIEWQDTEKKLQDCEYIIIKKDCLITCGGINWFNEYYVEQQEIDADFFIKTNGTCEETYLAKDLESALKKIENIHIALKKKVEKNKNQALEITNLLEQKKDLQEINDGYVEYIKELENRLDELSLSGANTNDTKSNYIDDLCNRLKEKDIIIAYLRSELK